MSDPTKPKTFYGCHENDCSQEATYPPDMLWWHDGSVLDAGWYCETCWYDGELIGVETGIRLDKWLEQHHE